MGWKNFQAISSANFEPISNLCENGNTSNCGISSPQGRNFPDHVKPDWQIDLGMQSVDCLNDKQYSVNERLPPKLVRIQ